MPTSTGALTAASELAVGVLFPSPGSLSLTHLRIPSTWSPLSAYIEFNYFAISDMNISHLQTEYYGEGYRKCVASFPLLWKSSLHDEVGLTQRIGPIVCQACGPDH